MKEKKYFPSLSVLEKRSTTETRKSNERDKRNMGENPEEYKGEIIFHTGNSLIASTVGKVRDVVTGVLFGDFRRILNPFTRKEKEALIQKVKDRFKDIHFKDDLHIYLGKSGFGKEYRKKMREIGEKPSFFNSVGARFFDIGINFSRSDAYNPSTNTISIFDEKYATIAHELGHAIDYNSYEGDDLRNTSSQKEKGRAPYLNDERIASNFAMRFMSPEERKKYSGDLSGAYGTYQGGSVGGKLMLPVWITGVAMGNPLVRWAGLLSPVVGASVGAYAQRLRNVFRREKENKNMFFRPNEKKEIDTNPYWDGLFSGNTVDEKESQKVKGLTYA